jgi:hypothetical protein
MENTFQAGESAHPSLQAFNFFIDGVSYETDTPHINREVILKKAGKSDCHSVYQLLERDFELVKPGDVIDLRQLGREKFIIKDPVTFDYHINKEPETSNRKELTVKEILKRAGIDPADQYLVQLRDGQPGQIYAWDLDAVITMVCSGLKFVTRPWVEMADIEELGKTCQPVPIAKAYRIKIQNKYHLVNTPFQPVEQLIRLGGKTDVENWDVLKFFSNQAEPVKAGHREIVDLRQACLIFIVLQPRKQTEGKDARRQFKLLSEDQEFLNRQGLPWETLLSPAGHCIIIHDYPIPAGYNVDKATLAIKIPPSYPASEIDMAYFSPKLSLKSGRQIRALSDCVIDGQTFQQWSRHRSPGQWVPGVDNVATHLFLVRNWLVNEING